MKSIPIPSLMQKLRRDKRGYPIPVGVLVDSDGMPHFTVNDEMLRQRDIRRENCGICGQKLHKARWFVGGPASAFHPNGAYIDPPMHEQCCKYALQVCPYLAAPKYLRRIEDRKVDAAKIPGIGIVSDPTMLPDRPRVFVAVMSIGQSNILHGQMVKYIKPKRPFRKIEYWMYGEQLDDTEGHELATMHLEALG